MHFLIDINKNDEEKLSMIMNKDGAVAKDLEAIKNSYNIKIFVIM